MTISNLPEKLRGTFNKPEHSDCVIHVDDKEFHVSKLVLTSQSDVFDTYFHHDSMENKSGTIKIEESTSQLVEMMLRFMYDEELENLDAEAYSLFILADRYNVVELKNRCIQIMRDNVQLDTIFDYLNLAYRVNDAEFKLNCLEYAAKHEEQIQDHSEWIQLTDSEPLIARDFCRHLCKRVKQLEKEATDRLHVPLNPFRFNDLFDQDFDDEQDFFGEESEDEQDLFGEDPDLFGEDPEDEQDLFGQDPDLFGEDPEDEQDLFGKDPDDYPEDGEQDLFGEDPDDYPDDDEQDLFGEGPDDYQDIEDEQDLFGQDPDDYQARHEDPWADDYQDQYYGEQDQYDGEQNQYDEQDPYEDWD